MHAGSRYYLSRILKHRSILFGIVLSIIGVFAISFLLKPLNRFLVNSVYEQSKSNWNTALSTELKNLDQNADTLAYSNLLSHYINLQDTAGLIAFVTDESKQRNVGILVADKHGATLARSGAPERHGDYVGETTAWGGAVLAGQNISSVEYGSLPSTLTIISGRQILGSHDQPIGGVFAANGINDGYAQTLRDRYFSPTTQIVFISKRDGYLASSLSDPAIKNQLQTYIGSLVPADLTQIKLDGQPYVLTPIALNGLHGQVGTILVLVPNPLDIIALLFTTLGILIFLLSEAFLHRYLFSTLKPPGHIALQIIISILIAIISYFAFVLILYHQYENISQKPAYTIYNSTIELSPDADLVQENVEQKIAIQVTTGGEAINVAQAEIKYDPSRVKIVEILTDSSFCGPDFFIEKSVDDRAGLINITCGLPNPGLTGSGILAELLVQPLQTGNFSLAFTDNTAVLANDGLGTNVLREKRSGGYEAVAMQTAGPESLFVYSPNHPNNTRWYNDRTVKFVWPYEKADQYRYALTSSNSFSFSGSEPLITGGSVTVVAPGDGKYFFRLSKVSSARTKEQASYPVLIDTTPPLNASIKVSNTNPQVGEVVRLNFSGTDPTSGLQSGYYVKFDQGSFLPVGPQLFIPFLTPGDHTITLRVFDKADNFSEVSTSIHAH